MSRNVKLKTLKHITGVICNTRTRRVLCTVIRNIIVQDNVRKENMETNSQQPEIIMSAYQLSQTACEHVEIPDTFLLNNTLYWLLTLAAKSKSH